MVLPSENGEGKFERKLFACLKALLALEMSPDGCLGYDEQSR